MVVKPPLANGYPRRPYDGISFEDVSYALNIGHPFGYTELTRLHTVNILEKLQKEDIIYVDQKKDIKHYFIQNRIASFIADLFTLLDNLILPRIEIASKNIEAATYNVYGDKNRKKHFGKFHDLRMRYRTMAREEKEKKEQEIKKLVENDDYNLYDIASRLRQDYRDLMEEQPFLADAFVDAICPPDFGKDSEGKVYPKIAIAGNISLSKVHDTKSRA